MSIEANNKIASNIGAYIASTAKDIVSGTIEVDSYYGSDNMVSGFASTKVSKSPAHISENTDINDKQTNGMAMGKAVKEMAEW